MESAESSNKGKGPVFEGVREIDNYNEKTSSSFQKPNPALEFCEKVMNKTSSEDYLAFLKCLHDYGTGKITMVDVKTMIDDYFPDFMDDFDYVLEFNASLLSRSSSESEREINIGNKGDQKPNKELDKVITQSYKFLAKHLSGVYSSGATELDKEVLNSFCYCKGSYSFRRNNGPETHEKMLNENEDELFERDMLMEWMRSTKENATKLFKAIEEGKIKKPTMEDVKNHFTSYNFRFIGKMYGETGSAVVDQLRHSPQTVLPVLINRLNQMERSSLWSANTFPQYFSLSEY